MLGKPLILSIFLNPFNKFNKHMGTHVRPSILKMCMKKFNFSLTWSQALKIGTVKPV